MQAIENTSKSAAARSGSSSTSTGPVTRSRARDENLVPNQVVVPVSKPPVKPRVQFREVVVSCYEKDKVSGSKVPHLELEENTLHQMPPPSFQYASDADSSTGSQSGSSPGSPKHLVSSPRSESHTFAPPVTMQVMMTGSMSIEEQLATMSRAFEKLTKAIEEKDFQIATLMNKLELQANEESNRDEVNETSKKGGANGRHDESTFDGIEKEDRSNSVASLSVQQLQDMITSTIRAQYGGPSRNNLMYSKPYTKRIDNMRMPTGYQPPKFQQFDGKGNPKQHVAHFVETCNNAGTEGDLLVKQFVRSLKGNAFDWYTDIEPESIDCWEAMEREFLNRFYSTRRSVSMMELTNTRQWKYEPVVDYINRWRSLSLDCKERLSEISAVEMCMQGMHWGLLYILQGNRPTSFEELATRAHDMEISIANHGGSSPALPDPRKETREGKKVERSSKMTGKESLAITTAPLKVPKKDKHKEEKAPEHLREKPRQQPSLKELEGKVYPFPDSDIPGILDFLLEKGIIELPESKRPEESGRVNEPRYCKYHRILGHKTEKCFILKELIMNLAKKGKIELDIDGVEESNHASVISSDVTPSKGPNTLNNILTMGARMMTIQFGTLDPVKVQLPQKYRKRQLKLTNTDDGGWTLVTRRKLKKQLATPLQLFRREKRRTKKGKQQCRKGRRHAVKKSCKEVDEGFRQEIPKSITLGDFFPSGYLKDDPVETVCMVSVHEDEHDSDEETIDENNESMLTFLRGLPLRFTLQEMFDLPQSAHEVLRRVLEEPKKYSSAIREIDDLKTTTATCTSCCASITFTDEDLQLGPKPHNRPLFVSGYIRERKVNRMLVDGGSAVNIMPKFVMKQIGITMDELSKSRLVIQGFNQGGQRAIGMIRLGLTIGELKSDTLFHVIDAKTSYNLLLGRPWAHENGVVPSTLHQCLKFYRDGEKKVDGDCRPFTEAESYFADAKFYMESETSQECLPRETSSAKKNEPQKGKQVTVTSQPEPKEISKGSVSGEKKPPSEEARNESPVFRYVPVSRRAEGQSPFVELVELKEVKVERVPKTVDVHVLKEELTIPLTTIGTVKLPLKGFVEPSRGMAKHPHPPSVKTYEGFDAKAQKLFKNSGYDFENPAPLGELSPELTGEKVHGLNETQKKLRQQGHRVNPPRMGVGYKPDRPIRVPLKSKQNRVSIKYITAEEVDESGDEQAALPRTSVFDRIQTSPSLNQGETSSSDQSSRTSAFKRLGVTTLNKNKIDSTRRPRASIFSRLGGPTGKIDDKNSEAIAEMEARHKEDKETRSLVPSRMKRKTKIDVSNDGILKAKRRTIVITGQGKNQVEKKRVNDEEQSKGKPLQTSSQTILSRQIGRFLKTSLTKKCSLLKPSNLG
ncbi:LOW QUALITY PROTEIN: hypothetical protein RJ640_006222 [Escallonia rubra]|uniref:Retrotransposon gag domain-containing protein n=1 Tax=Escallonia rubra TaxID=112253 RepID=A0AA88R299_9ASTE|nr:LOW QUALITY PROTEIN: hypothetical protein RJ640_006222 [Escallonia rubra]